MEKKIRPKDLIANWSYWFNDFGINAWDIYVVIGSESFPLRSITRGIQQVTYKTEKGEYVRKHIDEIDHILIKNPPLGYIEKDNSPTQ